MLTNREIWLIGSALYWAEGSKQKELTPSTGIVFTNSDPEMFKIFLLWTEMLGVPKTKLVFEIYIHDNRKDEIEEFKRWWHKKLSLPSNTISSVYYKRNQIKTNRKNTKDLYHGLLRIRVRGSTSLNRRVNGWIEGISASLGDRLKVGQRVLVPSI